MLSLDEVKIRLKDRNLKKVASSSGVSYPTIWRLVNTTSDSVEYQTVKKLSDYLEENK